MREQRLTFGEDPVLYDRVRPTYPPALVDDVAALVPPGGRIADIGCGTGKATVLLAARVAHGVGVEADPAMAAIAAAHLEAHGGWHVCVSEFEAWDGVDVDVLTAAQAWHWMRPVVRERKAAAVVRPGGWIALWWTRTDTMDPAVRRDLDGVYARLAPELPNKTGRPDVDPLDGFGPVEWRDYRWSRPFTTAEWTDLLHTASDHRMLGPARRVELLAAVGAVVDAHGGRFDHTYVTSLALAQRGL